MPPDWKKIAETQREVQGRVLGKLEENRTGIKLPEPTHSGNATLHRGKTKKSKKFKGGGYVKGQR